MSNKPITYDTFISVIQNVEQGVLDLSNLNLNNVSTQDLATAFSTMTNVDTLIMTESQSGNLFGKSSDELNTIFKALPQSVNTINLTIPAGVGNETLSELLNSALPAHVERIVVEVANPSEEADVRELVQTSQFAKKVHLDVRPVSVSPSVSSENQSNSGSWFSFWSNESPLNDQSNKKPCFTPSDFGV